MYLGNEAVGLSIFSAYACDTLQHLTTGPDGGAERSEIEKNFMPVFKGGMRMFLGSTDLFWSGWTTSEVGEDFAEQLLDGRLVINAWGDATQDWYFDHYPAGITYAPTVAKAKERRDGMKWQNFPSFSRFRDSDVKRFASKKWVD